MTDSNLIQGIRNERNDPIRATTILYLKDGRQIEVPMENIEEFIEDNWGNIVTEKKDWVSDPIVKSSLRL